MSDLNERASATANKWPATQQGTRMACCMLNTNEAADTPVALQTFGVRQSNVEDATIRRRLKMAAVIDEANENDVQKTVLKARLRASLSTFC
eukprot:6214769-Pleurochrysis_carterae.AAC.1